MTVAVLELGLGLPAEWVTPASRCYRPASWPPPRDWVVSEDRHGKALSQWGDPVWDLSPLAGKSFKLNFGDGPEGVAAPIDSANADLLRLIITWLLWGRRPIKAANTLSQAFQCFRPIIALCSSEGILASDLSRFPRVLERVPDVIAPSGYSATIGRLHRLLDARDKLGFILADVGDLKRLAAAAPDHEIVQTAYIPPRIWVYQVTRLKECLDDYLQHQQAIEDCFNFCVDAYAHNYGSLAQALGKPINSRLPFQTPSRPNAGRKNGNVFHGPFHLTAARFGLSELFGKWLVLPDNRVELPQLSSYLTLVQWAGLGYLSNFTLQRIEEAAALRADCLQFEDDEKLGRIPIICGTTTKTIQDSDARWPTSPSVQLAVDVMGHVARLRTRCAAADSQVVLTSEDVENPYLFLRAFEPWVPRPKEPAVSLTRRATAYQPLFRGKFLKLFDTQELTITKDDLLMARRLTPNLPETEFAIGQVWPLAWHQLRRTGAVNMFASGLLSDSSMQFLMKHANRLMPLYYGQGYTKLHLNEEVEGLVTTAMYEVMAKSMLAAMGDRFVSAVSAEQKQVIVVNLIGSKDAKALAQAASRGDVCFRETRLGACTSRTLCTYGGIESIARCAGGDGAKPCADVLFDRAKAPAIEKDLERVKRDLARLPEGSPRHSALLLERNGLENFLNAVRT